MGNFHGSSEISGIPVPRSTRNRQVVERSEVIGQIEAVIRRGLGYTTRERTRGVKGVLPLVSLVWLFGFSYEPSALEICVVTGVTVASSDQSGLPAAKSALIYEFAKFVIPKAMRLIRLMRLFIDSVGPLVTKELCSVSLFGQDLVMPAFQGSPK